jgi:hypothetical protein
MSNFKKILPMRTELFHADGQTDVSKPIVAFRSFAKALNADSHVLCEFEMFFFTFLNDG